MAPRASPSNSRTPDGIPPAPQIPSSTRSFFSTSSPARSTATARSRSGSVPISANANTTACSSITGVIARRHSSPAGNTAPAFANSTHLPNKAVQWATEASFGPGSFGVGSGFSPLILNHRWKATV